MINDCWLTKKKGMRFNGALKKVRIMYLEEDFIEFYRDRSSEIVMNIRKWDSRRE